MHYLTFLHMDVSTCANVKNCILAQPRVKKPVGIIDIGQKQNCHTNIPVISIFKTTKEADFGHMIIFHPDSKKCQEKPLPPPHRN